MNTLAAGREVRLGYKHIGRERFVRIEAISPALSVVLTISPREARGLAAALASLADDA